MEIAKENFFGVDTELCGTEHVGGSDLEKISELEFVLPAIRQWAVAELKACS